MVEENASPNFDGDLFPMDLIKLYRVHDPDLGINLVEIKHPHAIQCTSDVFTLPFSRCHKTIPPTKPQPW